MSAEPDETATADERLAMLVALINGDVALAYRLARDLLAAGVPFDDIVVGVLGPVQGELGRRWAAGDLGVAYEHAASAAVEDLLVRLGTVADAPSGPTVVVASAERDTHALGGRVVASALGLAGFRVLYLGASVPAGDLADYLDVQQPLALALSCSMASALVGAAGSVAAAHDVDVPVIGGGRALPTIERAARLGIDALASAPGDAVDVLRAWEIAPPERLGVVPAPVPEHGSIARRMPALVAGAVGAGLDADGADGVDGGALVPAEELTRLVQVVEAALLLDEPELVDEHVGWLRATGPSHGFARAAIDASLVGLAGALEAELPRLASVLRGALA